MTAYTINHIFEFPMAKFLYWVATIHLFTANCAHAFVLKYKPNLQPFIMV